MKEFENVFNYMMENSDLNNMEIDLLEYCMERYEDTKDIIHWFSDICEYGCISGCVPFLVYNFEVMNYLHEHLEDIEIVLRDMGEYTNEKIDMKEFSFVEIVWKAFEWMTYELITKILWVQKNIELIEG